MNAEDNKLGQAPERRLESWNRELGALVDGLDAPDLPERLVGALSCLVPFELAAVVLTVALVAAVYIARRRRVDLEAPTERGQV